VSSVHPPEIGEAASRVAGHLSPEGHDDVGERCELPRRTRRSASKTSKVIIVVGEGVWKPISASTGLKTFSQALGLQDGISADENTCRSGPG
jgi:hypothetical protein